MGHAFEKLAFIMIKHTLAPAPRMENSNDTVVLITFTPVSTPRVTVPTTTLNAPKKSPRVPLSEPVHIFLEENELSEI